MSGGRGEEAPPRKDEQQGGNKGKVGGDGAEDDAER